MELSGGIKARGGFDIDIRWENGKLLESRISGLPFSEVKVKYFETIKTFNLDSTGHIKLEGEDFIKK